MNGIVMEIESPLYSRKRRKASEHTRQAILQALRECGPLTAREIACEARMNARWIFGAVDEMRIEGAIESAQEDGKFQLVAKAREEASV